MIGALLILAATSTGAADLTPFERELVLEASAQAIRAEDAEGEVRELEERVARLLDDVDACESRPARTPAWVGPVVGGAVGAVVGIVVTVLVLELVEGPDG